MAPDPTPTVATRPRPAADAPAADPTGPRLPRGLVAAAVLAGVVARVVVLATPLGRPDADEVIAGLMARHLGDDGFPAFFWGQHYGGTIELPAVAASLRLLGWSVPALRVPTIVLAAVSALLVWRVGRHLLDRRRAALAGLLVWVAPPAAVWFGVREMLFYGPTTVLGLVLALLALRIRATGRAGSWLLAGLVTGLGLWTSTTIAYFVVPAVVVAAGGRPWRNRRRELARGVPLALAGLVVGAAPWWWAVLTTDGAPLRAASAFGTTGTYPERFLAFLVEGLPGALGFRAVFTHDWIGGPLGVAAYLGVAAVLAWSLRRSWRERHGALGVGWAAVGLVAYPFLYAAIPFVLDDPNLRYTVYVVPFVALVLAAAATRPWAPAVALALAVVVTGVGLARLHTVSELEDHADRVGNVGDLGPAVAALEARGIDAVWGDYWVAYRIAFETEERIVATPSWGLTRYEPYERAVRADDLPAWVVEVGPQLDALERGLEALGVGAEVVPAGDLAVVVPERPVDPAELPDAARHGT